MEKKETCQICKKEILHTLSIHNSVWHEKDKATMIECKFCSLLTPNWDGHYMLFHEKGREGGVGNPNKLNNNLKCGLCKTLSVTMEYHLQEVHKIEDCKYCKTAMTNVMKHSCPIYGKTIQHESTYCLFCEAWIPELDRSGYVNHLKSHMNEVKDGCRICSICSAAFPDYDKASYSTHSCGETRRSKKGNGMMTCGKCFETFNSLEELHTHYQNIHWNGTRTAGLSQAEIDFEKAKSDRAKFPCFDCKTVFNDGFEWDKHTCIDEIAKKNKAASNVLLDVASKLKNIGKPDPNGGIAMIQCVVCGNRSFHDKASYDKHACMARGTEKKRVTILVSPEREDKTHMDFVATCEVAKNCIVFTRGIPTEDYLLTLMRQNNCTVVNIGADNPTKRDQTVIQQADIVLAFPSKKDTKGGEIRNGQMTVGGIKVKTIVYPDTMYFDSPPIPAPVTTGTALDAYPAPVTNPVEGKTP